MYRFAEENTSKDKNGSSLGLLNRSILDARLLVSGHPCANSGSRS